MAQDNSDAFEFSEGVAKILSQGEEGWIDVIPWDFKETGWIDIIPWDFKVNNDGVVSYKDVDVAKVQDGVSDEAWLASLLTTLNDEGFF